jgi:hypothetical protein
MSNIIYKLKARLNPLENTLVYIGSTKQGFNKRLSKHKYDYKRYLNGKYHYVSSFELFEKYGVDGVNIEVIEEFNNYDKIELLNKEKHYINTIECVNIYHKLIN